MIVENSDQQILLQKRSDTGERDAPGGGVEIGDSFTKSAAKELYLSLLNILKPV